MTKQSNGTAVPPSQVLRLGHWDTATAPCDSQPGKVPVESAKVPVLIGLQPDFTTGITGTPRSEVGPSYSVRLGRNLPVERVLEPQLRQWIDRVIVPALLRIYSEEQRNDTSELPK